MKDKTDFVVDAAVEADESDVMDEIDDEASWAGSFFTAVSYLTEEAEAQRTALPKIVVL